MEPSISEDLKLLISRIAAVPRGLALLHQADPECVAIRLGVHAFVVVEAKRILAEADGRRWMIEKVHQAQAGEAGLRADPPPDFLPPPPPPAPRDAGELIRAAEDDAAGLPFLTEASPEFVAATFHVHPDLVFEARELLRRRSS